MARSTLITILVLSLTLVGLLFVASASVVSASRDFQDPWYYLKLQSIWALLGVICFFVFSRLPYQNLEKISPILRLITLISLVAVLIPGIGHKFLGARRWLNFGLFSFQPSELAKFSLVIYFSKLLSSKNEVFKPFIFLLGLVCGLIMLQPDLGTTIIITGISLFIYLGSANSLRPFAIITPLALGLILLLAVVSPYRRQRLTTFLNPDSDPQGASYHIHQIILSLGSGGFWGVGFGQSRQKYDFLPEVTTDSIFAIIAEELGFVGSTCLILVFLILITQGLAVSKSCPTQFGRLLALGITCWLGLQIIINLASMTALFPLTGIPLPFISYGGTSLVLVLVASGILVNIAKKS